VSIPLLIRTAEDIVRVEDMSNYLIEHLSPDTKWAIYKDLFDKGVLDFERSDLSGRPCDQIGDLIWDWLYTAGYNLLKNGTKEDILL